MSFHVPHIYRVKTGALASRRSDGNNGAFILPARICPRKSQLNIIASDGDGEGIAKHPWEHVSISNHKRCPYWDEMCFVKGLFWDDEDVVVQFHPRKSQYVNNHPNCLHLWRPVGIDIPVPPMGFV